MNASYIEAWPKTCRNYQNKVLIDHSEDGSVFQSPSATAFAFMTTGNTKFLAYLESIVKRCGHGGGFYYIYIYIYFTSLMIKLLIIIIKF